MKMPQERGVVLAAFLLLFAAATYLSHRLGEPGAGHLTPAAQRKPLADLSLMATHGRPWIISQQRGQVLLINLWATWCGPCQEETPGLVRLASALPSRDLAIMGLSLDAGGSNQENLKKVSAFVDHFRVPYPIAFPSAGSQMEFGVEGIPTTILIDREGRVAKVYEGAVRQQVFQADIEQLLHGG